MRAVGLRKSSEFSGAFREGISETLVLLAVHGVQLFKMRLGMDAAMEALLCAWKMYSYQSSNNSKMHNMLLY